MRHLIFLLSISFLGGVLGVDHVGVGVDGSSLEQLSSSAEPLPPRHATPPIPVGSPLEVSVENHYDETVRVNFVRPDKQEFLVVRHHPKCRSMFTLYLIDLEILSC